MSRITDPEDRSTAAVFADGAGAALLGAVADPGRIGPVVLGADGAGADHIFVERAEALIRMRGHETFREAVARLSVATLQAIRAAGKRLEDIDLVRLSPGQRADPERRRRASRPARAIGSSTASPSTGTRPPRPCRWRWPTASRTAACRRVITCCSARSGPASRGVRPSSSGVPHEETGPDHGRRCGDATRRRRPPAARTVAGRCSPGSRTVSAPAWISSRPTSCRPRRRGAATASRSSRLPQARRRSPTPAGTKTSRRTTQPRSAA